MTMPLPQEVSDLDVAFPARALEVMPPMEEIPDEFKEWSNPWVRFQSCWFGSGLSKYFSFIPVEVDGERLDGATIWRQLQVIQGSFAPQHEHKMAAIAYLASLWMETVIYGPANCAKDELVVIGDVGRDEWLDLLALKEQE